MNVRVMVIVLLIFCVLTTGCVHRARSSVNFLPIIRHNFRRHKRLRQTKTGMSPIIIPKSVSLSINPYHFSGQGLAANLGSLENGQMSSDVHLYKVISSANLRSLLFCPSARCRNEFQRTEQVESLRSFLLNRFRIRFLCMIGEVKIDRNSPSRNAGLVM